MYLSLAKVLLLRRHVLQLDVIRVALELAKPEDLMILTALFRVNYIFLGFFIVVIGFFAVEPQNVGLPGALLELDIILGVVESFAHALSIDDARVE